MTLHHDRLKEVLHYDPDTGAFTWKVNGRGRFARIGAVAGADHGRGYVTICVDGHQHLAHRLAFFYMTGRWPNGTVDHEDLNRANNRWANLREASYSENNANRRANCRNRLGVKGVFQERTGKYKAQITRRRKTTYLGTFDTAEAAHAAYASAARAAFGEFARTA